MFKTDAVIDLWGSTNGGLIIDFKTSNHLQTTYNLQEAIYAHITVDAY